MRASGERPQTVSELLVWRTERTPSQVALRVHGGASLTFEEWERRANAVSATLVERGLADEPVGILFASSCVIDYAVAWIGVQRAGGVPIMLPGAATDPEADELLNATGAAGIVTSPTRATLPSRRSRLTLGDGKTDRSGASPPRRTRPSDVAQVIFTSGTTGKPKGIAATHANLVRPALPALLASTSSPVGRGLFALPLGTNVAQTMLIGCLTEACTWIVLPAFTAEDFCAAAARYEVTETAIVPAIALALLDVPHLDERLSTVRDIGITGAPMPAAALARLARLVPQAAINNYYSSTEAAPAMVGGEYDPRRPGSIGRTDPGRCKIVPVSGFPAADGFTVGEVWLREPEVPSRRYYGDSPSRAGAFRTDGWTKTGDVGYIDEDGFLFLVDRGDDVINSGGMKVGSLEVQEALHELPAVAAAAVVGLAHPVLGQSIAAAVVSRAPTTEAELRGELRTRLAEYKIPHKIVLVDRLAQTPAGKLDKRTIAEQLANADAPRVPPRTSTERRLHALWSELLHRDDFGVLDRFLDLGGHSLLAMTVAARIEAEIGVRVPTSRMFSAGTISDLAGLVDELTADVSLRASETGAL